MYEPENSCVDTLRVIEPLPTGIVCAWCSGAKYDTRGASHICGKSSVDCSRFTMRIETAKLSVAEYDFGKSVVRDVCSRPAYDRWNANAYADARKTSSARDRRAFSRKAGHRPRETDGSQNQASKISVWDCDQHELTIPGSIVEEVTARGLRTYAIATRRMGHGFFKRPNPAKTGRSPRVTTWTVRILRSAVPQCRDHQSLAGTSTASAGQTGRATRWTATVRRKEWRSHRESSRPMCF